MCLRVCEMIRETKPKSEEQINRSSKQDSESVGEQLSEVSEGVSE